jgi:hypothetical protein
MFGRIAQITSHSFMISALVLAMTTESRSARCETSSGTSCSITCSVGTLTLSCSNDSKACSGSCSDSQGNMDKFVANLVKDIIVASEGELTATDVIWFLRTDFDPYRTSDIRIRNRYRTYTIHIGEGGQELYRLSHFFSSYDFMQSLDRVGEAYRGLDFDDVLKGVYIERLRIR